MQSLSCTEKGCNYVATNKKEVVAKRMLGNHLTRNHGIRSENAKKNDQYRRKRKRNLFTMGANSRRNGTINIGEQAPTPADPNIISDDQRTLLTLLQEFKHCPKCGLQLERHMISLLALIKHDMANELA